MSGLQINQLGNYGGGSQIDRHTNSRLRDKLEIGFIGQYQMVELFDMKGDRSGATAHAGQSAVGWKAKMLQLLLMQIRNSDFSFEQTHLTFTAGPFPTTWEFYAVFVQQIDERSLVVDEEPFSV